MTNDTPRSFFSRLTNSGEAHSGEADPPIPTRRRSERAAQAEAEWEQLENDARHWRKEADAQISRNSVLEESIRIMHEDLERTQRHNERLVRENTTMCERVKIAAEVLIGLQQGQQQAAMSPTTELSHDIRPRVTINTPANWPNAGQPSSKQPEKSND